MNRLYRSETNRMLGGVCGGIGAHLGIDPLWVRLAFVLFTLGPGFGVGLYIILWILMPSESNVGAGRRDAVQDNINDLRDRATELGQRARERLTGNTSPWTDRDQHLVLVGAVLVCVGVAALFGILGPLWWASIKYVGPIALVAVGIAILVKNLKDA